MSKQDGKGKRRYVKTRKGRQRPPGSAQALLAEGQRLLEADESAQAVAIFLRTSAGSASGLSDV